MNNIFTSSKLVYIFSCRIARDLIRNGFQIKDIFPNKADERRTVFAFTYSPALKEYLQNKFNIELKIS